MFIEHRRPRTNVKYVAIILWTIFCLVTIVATITLMSIYAKDSSHLREWWKGENTFVNRELTLKGDIYKMFQDIVAEANDVNGNDVSDMPNDTPEKKTCKPEPPMDEIVKCGNRIAERKCCEFISSLKYKKDLLERLECKKDGVSVINGREVGYREFPHMAAVGFKLKNEVKYGFMCGGSLISDRFVLTAGHCTSLPHDPYFAKYERKPYLVRLGVENITDINNKDIMDYTINNITVHSKYRSPSKYYDVALLKLYTKVTFTYAIHPACLSTDLFSRYTKINVTGWGKTNPDTEKGSDYLLMATVTILRRNQCYELLEKYKNRNFQNIKLHQFCAGVLEGGVDTCQGDSGGPAQVRINTTLGTIHRVIGVTSFGRKCAVAGIPAVYTRVATLITWIEGNVWPDYKQDHYEGFDIA